MRSPARCGLLVALACVAVGGATQPVDTAPPPEVHGLQVMPASESGSLRRAHRPPPACPEGEEGARFEVEYTGFPSEAETAFQAAVDTWACRIESPFPIRIDAKWEELDPVTLGSAGPFLHRNFEGAPGRDVWLPAALADLYAGRDLSPGRPDIDATFNAGFGGWDLDPFTPPRPGEYDLYTVVLHEIGHGLGLIGGFSVVDGEGVLDDGEGAEGPFLYDRFSVDLEGRPLLMSPVYPVGSEALGDVLQEAVAFDGLAVQQVNQQAAPLYAPSLWVTGGSYSHLDENAFPEGTADGLMTPFVRPMETIAEPGDVTCAMLADLGWLLTGDCAARVGALPGVAGRLLVFPDGPNPFQSSTRLRVVGPPNVALRADLFDVSGRRIRQLEVPASGELVVEGDGLAAGVVLVRITGEGVRAVLPLVRVEG
ncbi:MAG: hypothetical protein Rubg2KO_05300 [Rubricoccaceae bacterium]